MGEVANLDAARAARAEAEKEPRFFTFGDQQFVLPDELPYRLAGVLTGGDVESAMSLLLNGQKAAFDKLAPTNDDVDALLNGIVEAYGFGTLGESQASGTSSKPTSRSSRRPSKRTTA